MKKDSSEIKGIPPVYGRYNIHGGAAPYVPVAVENIPSYYTEENWKTRVITIRTIGIIRRLEHEFYMVESVDKWIETVQVPLTRGTNRQLKDSTIRDNFAKLEKKRKRKKMEKNRKEKLPDKPRVTLNGRPMPKIKDLPFPDSVTDPLSLGDTRVENGGVYTLLGKLQWANGKPIIDVHRFIPVCDLKATYEVFMLQCVIARKDMEFYKAHREEITEIVRRPEEKRNWIAAQPQKSRTSKR